MTQLVGAVDWIADRFEQLWQWSYAHRCILVVTLALLVAFFLGFMLPLPPPLVGVLGW